MIPLTTSMMESLSKIRTNWGGGGGGENFLVDVKIQQAELKLFWMFLRLAQDSFDPDCVEENIIVFFLI